MGFIKLETVHPHYEENNNYAYQENGSIIVNSSHIIDIYIHLDNNKYLLPSPVAEKYSKLFDIPASKLTVFKVSLIGDRNWYVIGPEEKFKDFK